MTLGKPWAVRHIPFGKRSKKLPTVLSDQEASRLLECVENPKHRAVLLTCYAAGLRLAEATHLRVADIDGQRAQIRITHGKGPKDGVVPASPRVARAASRVLETPAATQLSFPWQDGGRATLVGHHPEGLQAGRGQSGNPQAGDSPYAETFLRDRHARGGGRPANDQQAAGTFELCNDDGLSARAASTLRPLAQPDRLAASAAVSAVGRAIGVDAAAGNLGHIDSPQRRRLPTVCGGIRSDSADSGSRLKPRRNEEPRGDDLPNDDAAAAGDRPPAEVHTEAHELVPRVATSSERAVEDLALPHVGTQRSCLRVPAMRSRCHVYNSCTDRHCPQCAGARRADWLAKTRELLLPGVNYFQVVFTLPDRFSPLILGNRRELYDLLFRSAWQSLDEVLRRRASSSRRP